MIDERLIDRWVDRLRSEIPDAIAVLLKGSAARGEQEVFSDLDFDVLVDSGPRDDYLTWIDERDSRLVHISVAVEDLESWQADASAPVSWAYGLPAAETTQLLWARDAKLHRQLDQPARLHPPEEPELEDFIEAWGKIRNALLRNDDLAMRLAGQKLARLCPTLLRPLNPDTRPSNRREAMRAVLNLPVAPEGYPDDLLRCFGLAPQAVPMQELHDAGRRLTFGTVALLREHAAMFEKLLPGDLYAYLIDGTLDRYIRQ